jgi:hypothetical protein
VVEIVDVAMQAWPSIVRAPSRTILSISDEIRFQRCSKSLRAYQIGTSLSLPT